MHSEMQQYGTWDSEAYVAEWIDADATSILLELPRRMSVALVRDAGIPVEHVIDLGSGEGPYLTHFLRSFPDATGTWVDASGPMRTRAQERLAEFGGRVRFIVADVEQLDGVELEPASVVVTSRVFHHLPEKSLRRAYRQLHDTLVAGGFFFNLDHFGVPDGWEPPYRRVRKEFMPKGPEAKPHAHHFPYRPVPEHLEWLAEAGFDSPDAPWRMFLTALLVGRRPA